ncbi:MAG: hypothetical protein GIW99_02415 [Candidatus Eremiobacteraeota bacterium]|nr:hypothetical protein [Candidatus Eremiobacteraeota bacterium]MBC5826529.1 hypothetical protein [Candidatus Eremiobacteraeota bacterium]
MSLFSVARKTRFILDLPSFGLLVVRLFRDARVSTALKAAAIIGALLILSPLDLFGDIPLIGALDDVALLILLAKAFVWMCPAELVADHQSGGRPSAGPAASGLPIKNVTPAA